MLGNTLTVTYNTVPYVLTRINQDAYTSEFLYTDSVQEFTLKIRHSKVTKSGIVYDRHNAELRQQVFATIDDPEEIRMVYYVFEQLRKDQHIHLPKALMDLSLATSGAFLTSLTKMES